MYSTDSIKVDIKLRHGLALHNAGKLAEAETVYKDILKINPKHFDALQLLGAIAIQFSKYEYAFELLSFALKLNSSNANVHNNLSIALKELKRFEEALASSNRAIKLNRNFSDAFLNRGIVLQEMNQLQEALLSYEQAANINPNFAKAYSNRGNALQGLGRLDDALLSCNKAIELDGNLVEAYYNQGNILFELNRFGEALQNFNRAIELRPRFAEAFFHRGNTLVEINQLDEALQSYEKAYEIDPNLPYLQGVILHTKMRLCNWQDYETTLQYLLSRISQGYKCSVNLSVLAFTDSLEMQLKASQILLNDKYPPNFSLEPIPKPTRKKKIRLGYFSADFREHPVAYLTAELFEMHDRNNFELFAFYFGPQDSSSIHKRIVASFDKFLDVRSHSNKDIAQMSRDIGIDIAIDLTGLTKQNRVEIFSFRAAPVQLSYLGYLGTICADYYDYLIADKVLIPPESLRYYKEKIIYLPSYQVNDRKRSINSKYFTKEELGIPEHQFVFCCFNNTYKITPTTFDSWMRILKAAPNSILFIYSENKWAETNLKLEAEKRGVNSKRLIFALHIERDEYLSRYRVADLFLDTQPYGAGTTASDALWVGLPVLTRLGESFASRIAASLLYAVGLPEMITTTTAQYEAKAIEFANNPEKFNYVREKLKSNKFAKVLFDTTRFTKNIETAYSQIYERYQDDLLPTNIYIE